jgi:hypothetical protein
MFETLTWTFVVAFAVHNGEEAAWLPAWSRTAGRWHSGVDAWPFRFAVLVLTLAAVVVAWLATAQGPHSVGAYLISGFALAMLLNVFLPHVATTIALRRYMPGTATALLFILPASIALLREAFAAERIVPSTFAWAGPAVVATLAGAIPLLFAAGRRLQGAFR